MAIEAKANFLKQFEKKLATAVTVDTMLNVLSLAADTLQDFSMTETYSQEETDDMLDAFLEALSVQSRSEKTIKHYKLILSNLLKDINVPIRKITVYHLRNYIAKQKERGLKDSTIAHLREVCSSYFGWLFREGLIDKNPVTNLGTIKVAKEQKKTFSDVDMEKMRENCRRLLDKAIITFLASTGCRVEELVNLNKEAVDLNNLECIVHGKGNKERMVFFDNVTAMYVRNYLETRKDNCPALFVNRVGERFQTGGIRDMLKRLEEVSHVEHIHPHKFRRTLATNMAKRGVPIQTIASILGHDKIETTMQYIMLSKEDTKLKYRQYYAS